VGSIPTPGANEINEFPEELAGLDRQLNIAPVREKSDPR
jgi:hypothetical protein